MQLFEKIKKWFGVCFPPPCHASTSRANSNLAQEKRVNKLLKKAIAELEREIRAAESDGDYTTQIRFFHFTENIPMIIKLGEKLKTEFESRGYRTYEPLGGFAVKWDHEKEKKSS